MSKKNFKKVTDPKRVVAIPRIRRDREGNVVSETYAIYGPEYLRRPEYLRNRK